MARRLDLPRNPPITPAVEARITRRLVATSNNISRVAAEFSQTPARIQALLKHILKEQA